MVHGVFPQNGGGGGVSDGGGAGGEAIFFSFAFVPFVPSWHPRFHMGGRGGGLDGCCDVWCSFDTFKIEFSPKDEKKLRIFGKIFFGNVTQHCIGKCS